MSRFWSIRRGRPAGASAAVERVEHLEPVELYTAAALVTGVVEANGRRLSDLLNEAPALWLRDVSVTPYASGVAVSPGQDGQWQSVDLVDVLLVMPPDHASSKGMRLHRRQQRARISIGDFIVTGNLHLPSGVTHQEYRARRPVAFLPVTQATAYSTTDPAWERVAPVLLVNSTRVTDIQDVLTIV